MQQENTFKKYSGNVKPLTSFGRFLVSIFSVVFRLSLFAPFFGNLHLSDFSSQKKKKKIRETEDTKNNLKLVKILTKKKSKKEQEI